MGIFHADREKTFVIRKPKSDKWPKNMGAIHVIGDYKVDPKLANMQGNDNLKFGKLVEYESYIWTRGKDKDIAGRWAHGFTSADFWEHLRYWARVQGTIWMFGWRMWPAWCLLNGVKEISEQRLILDIRNGEDKVPGDNPKPRRSEGLFVAENPPTIICLAVPGGGRIKMIDLSNYGMEPEHFGLQGNEGALSTTIHAVKEYHRLCSVYDMGSMQTTAASQAWYCYRRSHMETPVFVHPMANVLNLEQAAYYGGRCECVRLGHFKKTLYHLDVNSMYTSLGLVTGFPHRYLSTWTEDNPSNPPYPSHMRPAVADVTIETCNQHYPARESVKDDPFGSPIRPRGRERIVYPVGKFRTALAGWELQEAFESNCVRKIHRIQYYEPAPIMQSWSKWALEMRASLQEKGFACMAPCAKKIMNSLPGKWGQRNKRWVDFCTATNKSSAEDSIDQWFQEWGMHPDNGEITSFRTIAGQTQYQDREELSAVSCPAIAAFWTAAGRMFLQGAITHCGLEHVYYYDTDSLIVDQEGYQRMSMANLIDQVAPGKWKIKEDSDDVEILGIRRYRFGPRWCVAGPFGGEKTGEGKPGEFIEHEGFGHQLWHRSVGEAVEVKRRSKWRKEYHHGYVDNDGIVWPFSVGDTLKATKDVLE